jgi:FixJ family two-component response regulator
MNYEALVIDDDPAIQDAVADILDSLGHKYDQARSQEDARRLIAAKRYSYYLLDLELPVRTDRGFPRIQTGENLLVEIVRRRGEEKAPIIVMTGHGLDCPDLAVRVMKKGAVDYVKKHFPSTGNTLDRAIMEVLSSRKAESQDPSTAPSKPKTATPFRGGEMVFSRDCVTLCGIAVVEGRTRMRKMLELLQEKRPCGKYVAYSGEKLAAKLGIAAGENAVSEAVKRFRDTVVERLEAKGIVCGRKDILLSGGVGYRLAETITICGETEPTGYKNPA